VHIKLQHIVIIIPVKTADWIFMKILPERDVSLNDEVLLTFRKSSVSG